MIDEEALRLMVDHTIAPYRGTLDDAAIAEMESALMVMFTSHPVIGATMRAAFPKPNAEQSGERGEDDAESGERKAGGDGK